MEHGYTASSILNFSTRWISMVSFTSLFNLHEKNPWYPSGKRLGGLQSQPGHCEVRKYILLLLKPSLYTDKAILTKP
jgi:hypothetical protein